MEFPSNLKDTAKTTPSHFSNGTDSPGIGNGVPVTRSDPNSPYPTTFVTADTSSFKQVVQMLTGSSHPKTTTTPPINKKQGFKLYERRNYTNLNKRSISPLKPNFYSQNASFSPRNKPEILSPSLLDFPSLTLSLVTPLADDTFDKSSPAIGAGRLSSDKGFYFHTDPNSTPRDSEPRLLPLFPLSSPR